MISAPALHFSTVLDAGGLGGLKLHLYYTTSAHNYVRDHVVVSRRPNKKKEPGGVLWKPPGLRANILFCRFPSKSLVCKG